MSKEEKIDISDAKFAHVMNADQVVENWESDKSLSDEIDDTMDEVFYAGFKTGVAAMAGLGEVDIDENFVQTLFITAIDLLAKKREEKE